MIARLTDNDALQLPTPDAAGSSDRQTDGGDLTPTDARWNSWRERGRSQVVFNGPPVSKDDDALSE